MAEERGEENVHLLTHAATLAGVGKNGQKMPETCDEICLDPPKPPFLCKGKKKKKLYIQNVGLHSCQLPVFFKKF